MRELQYVSSISLFTLMSGFPSRERKEKKTYSSYTANCFENIDGCCAKQRISGYFTPGTFQQYVLGPANYVTPIPDGLSSSIAAPLLCAGLTVYSALKRSQAQAGQWVVISGAGGGLGHIATQLSSQGLGHRVIGIDDGSKEYVVKESGAEHFFDITKFPSDDGGAKLAQQIHSVTDGLGAHSVIVCTSSNAAYAQAMSFLRVSGVLVCVGVPENAPVPIASAKPSLIIGKQLTIVGSIVGNKKEALETLEFGARGIIKPHLRIEKMENLTSIFEEMEKGQLKGRVVLDLS